MNGAAQLYRTEGELFSAVAEAVGKYTAAASGTPAANTVRSRLMVFPFNK
ncbi:hypothetical protein [Streptomyces dioscori]|nr:hypothetical protein [Streptomyces dioscori]